MLNKIRICFIESIAYLLKNFNYTARDRKIRNATSAIEIEIIFHRTELQKSDDERKYGDCRAKN